MASNFHPVILAGGRGTRFWPLSRKKRAKQLLALDGKGTMIQQTVTRLLKLSLAKQVWVVTNEDLRPEILRQLRKLRPEQVIAEPAGRNTAPAIGLAAFILQRDDPNAVIGLFPSDHVITVEDRFQKVLQEGIEIAAAGENIVVLGITPTRAETGYGYIEFGKNVEAGSGEVQKVLSFREKPDLKTAKKFVSAGRFFWNAGMFFWKAETVLEALRQHQPKTWTLLASLPDFGQRNFASQVADTFPRCENISIDYAVLEKARNVVGMAIDDIGWNDVGSWNAVYELLERNGDGNALVSETLSQDSTGNYVDAKGKLVALLGVKDLVVVDTPDALLIADRNRAQEVGSIVKLLEQRKREDLL